MSDPRSGNGPSRVVADCGRRPNAEVKLARFEVMVPTTSQFSDSLSPRRSPGARRRESKCDRPRHARFQGGAGPCRPLRRCGCQRDCGSRMGRRSACRTLRRTTKKRSSDRARRVSLLDPARARAAVRVRVCSWGCRGWRAGARRHRIGATDRRSIRDGGPDPRVAPGVALRSSA